MPGVVLAWWNRKLKLKPKPPKPCERHARVDKGPAPAGGSGVQSRPESLTIEQLKGKTKADIQKATPRLSP
ncbi:hypothetical protein FSARC_10188 [Fusarium sarcochroum]|uniref:Uncharacterized protein n=1 Tax=Fusarium sarcochroum TaxID=1208366 RepID=A0A8H4TNY3_9HYPO|nr:hypothetical protein FSARC_10188 [Fusarium sarcochroum]